MSTLNTLLATLIMHLDLDILSVDNIINNNDIKVKILFIRMLVITLQVYQGCDNKSDNEIISAIKVLIEFIQNNFNNISEQLLIFNIDPNKVNAVHALIEMICCQIEIFYIQAQN